jgi:hypothetical protein
VREFFRNQWDRVVAILLTAGLVAVSYILILDAFYTHLYPDLYIETRTAFIMRPDELVWMRPWLVPGMWAIALGVAAGFAYTVWHYRQPEDPAVVYVGGFLRTEWRPLLLLANKVLAGYAAWVAVLAVHFVYHGAYYDHDNLFRRFMSHYHEPLLWGMGVAWLCFIILLVRLYRRYHRKWPCAMCERLTLEGIDDMYMCPRCQPLHLANQAQALAERATAAVAEEPELECPVCSAPMTKIWYKTGDDGFIVYHHCPHDDTEVFPQGRRESVIEFVDL